MSGRDWLKYTGNLYYIDSRGSSGRSLLRMAEAQERVKKYRWIHINASLKDLTEAENNAKKLSSAVGGWPLVLVYLPRHVCDGTRNDYNPRFQSRLSNLIRSAMADGKEVLVTAKSYGVSQALRVIRSFDSPLILLIGISPAFGAFGNAYSDNVTKYINDVRNTRSKYCMIANRWDGFTWRRGGAAYRRRGGRGRTFRGDPKVGEAMENNKNNVHLIRLEQRCSGETNHTLDCYIRGGLVSAMKQAVNHFRMNATPVGDAVCCRTEVLLEGTKAEGDLWV
jgi:hypothetical protein